MASLIDMPDSIHTDLDGAYQLARSGLINCD